MDLHSVIGKKFNKLTIIEYSHYKKGMGHYYKCECDCGNFTIVRINDLRREPKGRDKPTQSCGKCPKNKYELIKETVIGYDSKNEPFLLDLEDYVKYKIYNYIWIVNQTGYVVTSKNKRNQSISLHRLIMNIEEDIDMKVDHINTHRKFDNRKQNLRVVTTQQNTFNSQIYSNNTTGVKGVYYSKHLEKWYARIRVNYEHIHLGTFDSFDEAVEDRKCGEEKYFGEYGYKGKDINNDIIKIN